MNASKQFHLGTIISITSGVLASPDGMQGVYDILNFMSDDDLQTLALIRVSDEVTPYLYEQLPFLRDATARMIAGEGWDTRLQELINEYGEYHIVRKMHAEDHEDVDPMEDARRLGFKGDIIPFELDEEEPPSPYGDINW